jgi:hypothetical protein
MAPTSRIADLPQSLADADNFPCNIVDKQTYIATLAAYRDRLGSIAGNLCYESESDAVVYFRDFDPGHGDHTQQRCSGITLTMVDPAIRTRMSGHSVNYTNIWGFYLPLQRHHLCQLCRSQIPNVASCEFRLL